MWNQPDEHSAQYAGSAANADRSTRSSARVRSGQPTQPATCFICDARDTIDREISGRWLAARLIAHTSPISQSQLFGVMCCLVHAWRMYATYAPTSLQTTPMAPGASDIFALQQVLNAIVQEFALLTSRLARRGFHSHSIHHGNRKITGMPTCPLCDEIRPAVDQKALGLFLADYGAANPTERQNLLWALCPSDHRLIFAYVSRTSELSQTRPLEALPPPPTPRPLMDSDGWWQVPGHSTHGKPFVQSLLDPTSDLPDQFCPLCWAQAHQEHMLAAVMQRGLPYTEDGEDAVVEVGDERWQFETALTWDIETLCSRHMALVRVARLSDTHTSSSEHTGHTVNAGTRPADPWNPSQWPSGALRATPSEATCPICRILSGWDAVRQEGLLRAARKTLLLEDISAQLREALKGRQTPLCLPHWRSLITTADREALDTLLGWQFRSVWALQDRLDEASRQLNYGHHTDRGEHDATDPRRAAYLFLAGYPR